MDKFKSMMAGKERLVITYWIWGVIGTTVVSFALGFLSGLLGFPLIVALVLTLAYWIPVAMGVWRSSNVYKGNQLWAILAKVAIGLGAISWIYQFTTVL